MTLAAAMLDIESLAAEAQDDQARRYAFYRQLAATDRVLDRLEELNRDGVRVVSKGARQRLRWELRDLPAECLVVYRDTGRAQEMLDSLFAAQERLFVRSPGQAEIMGPGFVEIEGDDDDEPVAVAR